MAFPVALQAALWGWLAASTLMLEALVGFYWQLPRKALATVMAYGSGVLIAALYFEQNTARPAPGRHLADLSDLLIGAVAVVCPGVFCRCGAVHVGRYVNPRGFCQDPCADRVNHLGGFYERLGPE
jgi:hypothetical protein